MQTPTTSIKTVSTVADGAQVMGIDAAGMGTVLSILSNMYSDGSLAVVREYSSNALDSHVEAGNPDPILITRPSHFNPIFTVQDFGTGLSHDEVLNVYAKYGSSTKRDTNDQIGAFGIGAKSAFTVGTQFVVTAVKNGEETVALFALNENGAPTVNIVSRQETLEPNGVKVEVGVKEVDGVNRAIDRLFATWKSGTVLIDGVEPVSVWDNLEYLADDVHLGWRDNKYVGIPSWTVVMGGIPYALPVAVTRSLAGRQLQIALAVDSSQASVYLTVPIGAVDITPSREELRVTPKTTETIGALVEKFSQLLSPWISKQIESAGSIIEALAKYNSLSTQLGSVERSTLSSVTWQGKPLPTANVTLMDAEWMVLRHKRGNYYGEKVASREKGMILQPKTPLDMFLFVTGVPEKRVRSVQLAAKPFLAEQDQKTGVGRVVALTQPESHYDSEWFSLSDPALDKVDFDTFIKEWKPATTPGQRHETRYNAVGVATELTATDLNQMGEVLYVTHAEWNQYSSSVMMTRVRNGRPVVVLTPTQKKEALVRRVPKATSAVELMRKEAADLLDNLDQSDTDTLTARSFLAAVDRGIMDFLIANKKDITNPVVLKMIDQYKLAVSLEKNNVDRIILLNSAARVLARDLRPAGKSTLDSQLWLKISGGLPLLVTYFDRTWNRSPLGNTHAIQYVNTVTL